MSVIIRLQNLPWSATSVDIRTFFKGLSIPEGGVHIVGGERGDAFIAFSSDEDARQAMMLTGSKLKEETVSLFLSSRVEMQKVIELARNPPLPVIESVKPAVVRTTAPKIAKMEDRQDDIRDSRRHSRSKDRESSSRSGRRGRSRSRSPRSRSTRERDREYNRRTTDRSSKSNERERDRSNRDRNGKHRDSDSRNRDSDRYKTSRSSKQNEGKAYANELTRPAQDAPNDLLVKKAQAIDMRSGNFERNQEAGWNDGNKNINRISQTSKVNDPTLRSNSGNNWNDNKEAVFGCASVTYDNQYNLAGNTKSAILPSPVENSIKSRVQEVNSRRFYYIQIRDLPVSASQVDVKEFLTGISVSADGVKFAVFDTDHRRHGTTAVYVKMSTYDDFSEALKRHKKPFGRMLVEVHPATEQEFFRAESCPPRNLMKWYDNKSSCVTLKGLPYKASDSDVYKFFSDFKIKRILIIRDQLGNAVGDGFVEFFSVDDARESIDKNRDKIGHKYIEVMPATRQLMLELSPDSVHPSEAIIIVDIEPKPVQTVFTILMQGVPFNASDRDIAQFFSDGGTMPQKVHILLTSNGMSTGEAFAEFKLKSDAERALGKNNKYLGLRPVRLKPVPNHEVNEVLSTTRHVTYNIQTDAHNELNVHPNIDGRQPDYVSRQTVVQSSQGINEQQSHHLARSLDMQSNIENWDTSARPFKSEINNSGSRSFSVTGQNSGITECDVANQDLSRSFKDASSSLFRESRSTRWSNPDTTGATRVDNRSDSTKFKGANNISNVGRSVSSPYKQADSRKDEINLSIVSRQEAERPSSSMSQNRIQESLRQDRCNYQAGIRQDGIQRPADMAQERSYRSLQIRHDDLYNAQDVTENKFHNSSDKNQDEIYHQTDGKNELPSYFAGMRQDRSANVREDRVRDSTDARRDRINRLVDVRADGSHDMKQNAIRRVGLQDQVHVSAKMGQHGARGEMGVSHDDVQHRGSFNQDQVHVAAKMGQHGARSEMGVSHDDIQHRGSFNQQTHMAEQRERPSYGSDIENSSSGFRAKSDNGQNYGNQRQINPLMPDDWDLRSQQRHGILNTFRNKEVRDSFHGPNVSNLRDAKSSDSSNRDEIKYNVQRQSSNPDKNLGFGNNRPQLVEPITGRRTLMMTPPDISEKSRNEYSVVQARKPLLNSYRHANDVYVWNRNDKSDKNGSESGGDSKDDRKKQESGNKSSNIGTSGTPEIGKTDVHPPRTNERNTAANRISKQPTTESEKYSGKDRILEKIDSGKIESGSKSERPSNSSLHKETKNVANSKPLLRFSHDSKPEENISADRGGRNRSEKSPASASFENGDRDKRQANPVVNLQYSGTDGNRIELLDRNMSFENRGNRYGGEVPQLDGRMNPGVGMMGFPRGPVCEFPRNCDLIERGSNANFAQDRIPTLRPNMNISDKGLQPTAVDKFGNPGCVVGAANIPYRAGVSEILDFFTGNNISKENIIRRFNENGQVTGDARIAFRSPFEAQKVVRELNHKTIGGRVITLFLL